MGSAESGVRDGGGGCPAIWMEVCPAPVLTVPGAPSLIVLRQTCESVRREGTAEAVPEAVRQAGGGGCRSGRGAVTVGYTCR